MSEIIFDYLRLKRSERSRKNIGNTIKMFLNWRYSKKYESVAEVEYLAKRYLRDYKFKDLIEFLLWMRDTVQYQPMTINTYMVYVTNFLTYYEIVLSKSERAKLHKIMPRAVATTQDRPLTKDLLYEMCTYADPLMRAVILLATSSGMRIQEIVNLELNEVEYSTPCKIRLPKTKMKQGRPHVYRFSEEAAEALYEWSDFRKQYLKRTLKFSGEIPPKVVKREFQNRVFPIQSSLIYFRWNKLLDLVGINVRDKETNRHVYTMHGCRRWFSSTASRHIPHEMAEAMIGHDTGLSASYRRYPEDDLDEQYMRLEPHLSLFAHERVLVEEDRSEVVDTLLETLSRLTFCVSTLNTKMEMLERQQKEKQYLEKTTRRRRGRSGDADR